MELLQKEIFSNLEQRIEERKYVIDQIESFKVEFERNKPITLAIPFWVLVISKKEGDEVEVFPPMEIKRPAEPPVSDRKYVDFTVPIMQSLEMSAKYLNKDDILSQVKRTSVLNREIGKDVEKALNGLVEDGLVAEKYATRIKEYYGMAKETTEVN